MWAVSIAYEGDEEGIVVERKHFGVGPAASSTATTFLPKLCNRSDMKAQTSAWGVCVNRIEPTQLARALAVALIRRLTGLCSSLRPLPEDRCMRFDLRYKGAASPVLGSAGEPCCLSHLHTPTVLMWCGAQFRRSRVFSTPFKPRFTLWYARSLLESRVPTQNFLLSCR